MADQKVFISWSGELSKKVAYLLKDWIPNVIQGIEPWVSEDDIEKGSIWFTEVSDQIAETSVGIICLTQENISNPWILFEAGGLSKGLTKSRVCTLLVDVAYSQLDAPLNQIQGTRPVHEDMLKLMRTLNSNTRDPDTQLPNDKLEKSFDKWWADFETEFSTALSIPSKASPKRSQDDVLEEILSLTRSIHNTTQEGRVRTLLVDPNPNRPISGSIEQEIGLSSEKIADQQHMRRKLLKVISMADSIPVSSLQDLFPAWSPTNPLRELRALHNEGVIILTDDDDVRYLRPDAQNA